MMEYSILGQCNHKARLDGPKACRLAWHPWLDSRIWIIFGRYDSVHGKLFEIEPNNTSQIKLFTSNSLKGIMTSAGAGKVTLIWGIDIPEVSHFLFLPVEA